MDRSKALEGSASTSHHVDDDDDPSCQVVVRGLPDVLSNNDLFAMMVTFSTFGEVRILNLGADYAILEFSTPEEAQQAVSSSEKINLDGHIVTIKMKKAKQKNFNIIKNSCGDFIVNPKDLNLNGTFIQQVREITRTICFKNKHVDAFPEIAADVQKAIK